MQFLFLNLVASAYGEGAYNNCAYNEGCVAGSSTTTGGGTALSDTGFLIVLVVSAACLLIFVALLARWIASRNSPKRTNTAATQRAAKGNN